MNPSDCHRLESAINALLAREIAPGERAWLEARLAADPEARACYSRQLGMHVMLEALFANRAQTPLNKEHARSPFARLAALLAIGIGIVMLSSAAIYRLTRPNPVPNTKGTIQMNTTTNALAAACIAAASTVATNLAAAPLPAAAVQTVSADGFDSSAFGMVAAFDIPGYTATETLTNFPLVVQISSNTISGFLYSDLAYPATGSDIRFAAVNGASTNFLSHEYERWDPAGTSLAWVRIPELTASTKLLMYYGSPETTAFPDATDVWRGYYGVWHMNAGNSASQPDSTAGAHPLTCGNNSSITNLSGKIGSGVLLSPNRGSSISVGVPPNMESTTFLNAYFSAWFVRVAPLTHGMRFFSLGQNLIESFYNTDGPAITVRGTDSTGVSAAIPSDFLSTLFTHVAIQYRGATVDIYTNGVLAKTLSGIQTNSTKLVDHIGIASTGSGYSIAAKVDEARVYTNGTVTAARFAAEVANANPDTGFLYSYQAVTNPVAAPQLVSLPATATANASTFNTSASVSFAGNRSDVTCYLLWGTNASAPAHTDLVAAVSGDGILGPTSLTNITGNVLYTYRHIAVDAAGNCIASSRPLTLAAGETHWSGAAGTSDWSDDANWNNGAPHGEFVSALFDENGPAAAVSITNTAVACSNITIFTQGKAVNFNLASADTTLTLGKEIILRGAAGSTTISNGTLNIGLNGLMPGLFTQNATGELDRVTGIIGRVMVGAHGGHSQLTLDCATRLTNPANLIGFRNAVGYATGESAGPSDSNTLLIRGGSRLDLNVSPLYIGYSSTSTRSSSHNRLIFDDGVLATFAGIYVGASETGSDNGILVSGSLPGKIFTGAFAVIGEKGNNNWMTITDGAVADLRNITLGNDGNSCSNTLTVNNASIAGAVSQISTSPAPNSKYNSIVLSGTTPYIACTDLTVTNVGATLRFILPTSAYATTPIRVSGTATFDANTRLAVDVRNLTKSGFKGEIINAAYFAGTDKLQIVVEPADSHYVAELVRNGTHLYLDVRYGGTMVIMH